MKSELSIKMQLQDWFDVFSTVCVRGQEALKWDIPEAWVHAELYAELRKRERSSGWMPFFTEVPYVTVYPVQLPKKTNRDWKVAGAVKWVDLCLRSKTRNAWCWFEFKVRHIRKDKRHQKAALDAFRKDVVALMGFDLHKTADIWIEPDRYTRAYWLKDLRPCAEGLRSGRHHLVAAFLQLDSELDLTIWGKKILTEQIRDWFSYRNKQADRHRTLPEINIKNSVQSLTGKHSLLVCEWSLNSEEMSHGL